MATIDITYDLSTITATSGEFSQHEPIKVNLALSGTTEACSVSMKFADWEFHMVPQGGKKYQLDLSRAMRKATKGIRISTATEYAYQIRVVTESGAEHLSDSKSVTICAGNLATYGEDELDRAFQEVTE